MAGGLMGMVAQGMAWGTGSSIARVAVGSVLGPSGGYAEQPAAAAPPAPAFAAAGTLNRGLSAARASRTLSIMPVFQPRRDCPGIEAMGMSSSPSCTKIG